MQERKRRSISDKERKAIFAAWNNVCAYCEQNPAEMVDHIVPFSKGGECILENFAASCKRCNLKKTNHSFGEGYLQIILAIAKSRAEKIRKVLEATPKKPVRKKVREKRPENCIIASRHGDWEDMHTEIVNLLTSNNEAIYTFNTKDEKSLKALYVFNAILKKGEKYSALLGGISYCRITGDAELRIPEGALEFLRICADKRPKAEEIIEL